MKNFNWEEFKDGEIAVHCDTEEKANDFLSKCKENGVKWHGGVEIEPDKRTNFENYKDKTCYSFDCFGFGFADLVYHQQYFEIIKWEKTYKIQDLFNDEFVGKKFKTNLGDFDNNLYEITKQEGSSGLVLYEIIDKHGVDIGNIYNLNALLKFEFELVEEEKANEPVTSEIKIPLKNLHNRVEKFGKKHKIKEIVSKYNFNNEVKVYLASGFLFEDLGQIGLEILADVCEAVSLNYYLPQKAEFNNKETTDFTITNKMITDGDNDQLKTCQFVLAHIQSPMDDGVCGEISRFKTMSEYEPNNYWGVAGWVDDIRLATKPNLDQPSFHNQVCYLNQYIVGEVENSLGCYETLDKCFEKIYKVYLEKKRLGDLNW